MLAGEIWYARDGNAAGSTVAVITVAGRAPTEITATSSSTGSKAGKSRRASMAAAREEWRNTQEDAKRSAPMTARMLAMF
jgi:hypothetical protein